MGNPGLRPGHAEEKFDGAITGHKNPGGHGIQISDPQNFAGGTGLTRNKKQQMEALAFNAVKKVEDWLLEHPEWFDMTQEELETAMALTGRTGLG